MVETAKAPLSVLIPARNEARNLAACLDSVGWAAEVVVLDSGSEDETPAIARAGGARVVERPFDGFAAHKNWALGNIPFRHPWVLMLDADERVTPELAAEIRAAIAGDGGPVGYYIARQNHFMGRPLRHGGMFPDYNLRLLRLGHGRFEDRLVHEHVLLDGPAGFLETPLIHDDDKGLERYFERHNHYSSLEAVEIRRLPKGETLAADLGAIGPQRRRALKSFAERYLPGRPLLVFLYMYVLRLGFLDGRAGFRYCVLRMFYEYQISLKLIELDDARSALARRYREHLGS